jgi:hypothetical protein
MIVIRSQAGYSRVNPIGVPSSTVLLTVQRRSWEIFRASGSSSRALSPSAPWGKLTVKVTPMSASRLACCSSLILVPERVRLGPARGQHVDVDRGAGADGGEQQLDRGEGVVAAVADADRAAALVAHDVVAVAGPVDAHGAAFVVRRHGINDARQPSLPLMRANSTVEIRPIFGKWWGLFSAVTFVFPVLKFCCRWGSS